MSAVKNHCHFENVDPRLWCAVVWIRCVALRKAYFSFYVTKPGGSIPYIAKMRETFKNLLIYSIKIRHESQRFVNGTNIWRYFSLFLGSNGHCFD